MPQTETRDSNESVLGINDVCIYDPALGAVVNLELLERPEIEMPPASPNEYGCILFRQDGGGFVSGVWQGEAGTILIDSYPADEFCHLVEGEVTLTDADGNSRTFKPGMSFLVPRGFRGSWHMPVRSKKFFACCGDPAMVALLMGQPVRRASAAE